MSGTGLLVGTDLRTGTGDCYLCRRWQGYYIPRAETVRITTASESMERPWTRPRRRTLGVRESNLAQHAGGSDILMVGTVVPSLHPRHQYFSVFAASGVNPAHWTANA